MKRFISILSIGLSLSLVLSACQNNDGPIGTSDNTTSNQTETPTTESTTTEATTVEATSAVETTGTTTEDSGELAIDDLVRSRDNVEDLPFNVNLPELLIDSEDGSLANTEIEELEQRIRGQYEASDEDDYEQLVDYEAFLNDDILSVVITVLDDYEENEFGHFIYNFDITTGELLSDENVVNGFSGTEVDLSILREEVLAQAARAAGDELETEAESEVDIMEGDFPHYIGLSDQYVGETLLANRAGTGLTNNQVIENVDASKFYLGEEGELRMMGAFPEEEDFDDFWFFGVNVVSEFFDLANERRINPLYTELLSLFEITEETDDNLGLIAFIDAVYDHETINRSQEKLLALELEMGEELELSPLLSTIIDEELDILFGTFTELYLIVPKYNNDIIRLYDVALTDGGELLSIPIERADYDVHDLAMHAVALGITTETLPTGVVRLVNLAGDSEIFYPYHSARDGSFMIPDNYIDISSNIENVWENSGGVEIDVTDDLRVYITAVYGLD